MRGYEAKEDLVQHAQRWISTAGVQRRRTSFASSTSPISKRMTANISLAWFISAGVASSLAIMRSVNLRARG